MIHVGVDIGKTHHCAAAIEENGQIRLAPWRFKQEPVQFDRLDQKLRRLGSPEQVHIGMEATGHYWMMLHAFLIERGWQVDVFNPILSAARARTHLRGRKSDPDDALADAKVVRDGDYTPMAIESAVVQEIKTLCRQRRFMAAEITNAKKRLISLVDVLFPEFSRHFSEPCGATALAVLEAFPSAHRLSQAHLTKLTHLIAKASRQQLGRERAKPLREDARQSLARGRQDSGREYAASILIRQIHFFLDQRAELDARIAERYAQLDHPVDTIPGIGPTTGPTILSEIGDIKRFATGHTPSKLLAYAGADARIRTSGQWRGKDKMTKRGSRSLRTALYQAAQVAVNVDPAFRAIYDKHRQRGKHHKVAISHVMRKILAVIYALMRDNVPYDSKKISQHGG